MPIAGDIHRPRSLIGGCGKPCLERQEGRADRSG